MDNWYRWADKKPEVCEEVLMYSKEWIDEDYNPSGVSLAFLYDDGSVLQLFWDNELDFYDNRHIRLNSKDYPTHWQPKPTPPKD